MTIPDQKHPIGFDAKTLVLLGFFRFYIAYIENKPPPHPAGIQSAKIPHISLFFANVCEMLMILDQFALRNSESAMQIVLLHGLE